MNEMNRRPYWVLPVTGFVNKRQIKKGLLTMKSPAKRTKSAAPPAALPNTASFEEKSKGMIKFQFETPLSTALTARDGTSNERNSYQFMWIFHLKFHLLRFTLYMIFFIINDSHGRTNKKFKSWN